MAQVLEVSDGRGRLRRLAARWLNKAQKLSARAWVKITLVLLAVALALFQLPSWLVDRFYSNGIYPHIQSLLTPVANLIPFAIADVLIMTLVIVVPAVCAARLIKARRGERRRAMALLAGKALVWAAVCFLIFELLWGLNYARTPLDRKLDYDDARLNQENIRQLKRLAVEQLNAEYPQGRAAAWPDDEEWQRGLLDSFNQTVIDLGNRGGIARAVPKSSLLNFYLAASGVEGFINPFGHEVVLDSTVLPFEKPFLLAHEWAHLAGFADESEANFVGALACLRSELPAIRYSGWLAVYQYTPWPPPQASVQTEGLLRKNLPPMPSPEVQADIREVRERVRIHQSGFLTRAQWVIYDGFLRANRVRSGIRSYGRFIRLMTGTRFEPGWVPAQRSQ
jgi:hypothetical protein